MSIPSNGRRARRSALALISAGAVVAGVLGAVPAATAAGDESSDAQPVTSKAGFTKGRYIVTMREPSATQYRGGEPGLSATRVAPGRTFDARTAKVRDYTQHLVHKQTRAARDAGVAQEQVGAHYTIASNAFLAELKPREAAKLASDDDVLLVSEDVRRHQDTWNTPSFLGLDGRHGAWHKYAGSRRGAGDGVVIGDIDSGIWPESRSVRGVPLKSHPRGKWDVSMDADGNTRMEKVDGSVFNGLCQTEHETSTGTAPAEQWTTDDCSSKLIGARYYPDAFLDGVPVEDRSETEVISTRDGGGHGTHTATTAAGQFVHNVKTEGRKFGDISGMAPGAKIAAYKVCFDDNDPDTGGCYTSSILSAIDDAVADGVDVINFSISGATDTVIDQVELAFEGAAEAGVFVATSAGNSGPGESTVAHNSPWLTTVAANTHVNLENTVRLGNGVKIRGASISDEAIHSTKLVDSKDSGVGGADPEELELCGPDTLDPAKVADKIVVCARGVYDRVAKSEEVDRAGGKAMILANVTPGSLDADFHSVPTIHISDTNSPKVYNYLDKAGNKARAGFQLGDTTGKKPTPLPQIAGFSSRGPATANNSDLLKPDISAPGVSVLAAVAPPSNHHRKYDLYSGTSMASPHIAGLAGFMLGVHPHWTPMEVKSAMMTTARSLKGRGGGHPNDPFAQGAGMVHPKQFFDPGLFVTSDATDWWRFIQGQTEQDLGVEPMDPKELNGPSLADSAVVGQTEFTREFVSTRKGTWKVSAHVPGFTVSAPHKLVAKRRGDIESITIDIARTDAPFDQWATGFLTLTGPTRVRLPIAVKPTRLSAPDEVAGEGTDGSVDVPVSVGDTVDLTAHGLNPAETLTGSTSSPQSDESDIETQCITVPEGATAARFALDAEDDTADMDLWVYQGCDEPDNWYADFYAYSATGSADESVTLMDPEPGDYLVAADPFEIGDEPTLNWRLDSYVVDDASAVGDLTVDPNPLTPEDETYTASWTGLDADQRYLGVIEYEGSEQLTFLTVDTAATP